MTQNLFKTWPWWKDWPEMNWNTLMICNFHVESGFMRMWFHVPDITDEDDEKHVVFQSILGDRPCCYQFHLIMLLWTLSILHKIYFQLAADSVHWVFIEPPLPELKVSKWNSYWFPCRLSSSPVRIFRLCCFTIEKNSQDFRDSTL